MCFVIEDLSGEDAGLESDDLRLLIGGGSALGLRVDEARINGLAYKTGLASIPHNRCQETEIGNGQRAPIHRYNTRCRTSKAGRRTGCAPVWIIHVSHCELQNWSRRHR